MRKLIALLSVLCLASATTAQQKDTKLFPYNYTIDDLANGLRLVTVPTDFPNMVALYIVVQTGSRNEVEPGKSGYAHLFEHIMFRGSENYSPEQRDLILKKAGAESNATTNSDRTTYYETFSKEDLEPVMKLEADRFQRLKYPVPAYKTESLAVLGEYNKNSADPTEKLDEVLHETAFTTHTYRHTTMGFLKDIQDMPNQYDYSLQFYNRFYRPEYTTIILVGDLTRERALELAKKYFGEWKHGNYAPNIPAEPPQTAPGTATVDWNSPTLPWLAIAFKAPAYSDEKKDKSALDLLSPIAFGSNSDLYQRLVLKEQKVDELETSFGNHPDPELFTIYARVKDGNDIDYVREQILATFKRFTDETVDQAKLDATRSRLRYSFALRMNSSSAIASALAQYIGLRRTPETINKLFALYQQITPEDLRTAARQYFTLNNRTIVTLRPPARAASVLLPGTSPLVTFRILFMTGSAFDPPGKEGVAALTAAMLAEGGTRSMSYDQIVQTLYPMASSVNTQIDKEMTVFTGTTHIENLDRYYALFKDMLLDPGFRPEDFKRLRDVAINFLKVSLREANDEELGKEQLYNIIYAGHPYGHHNTGTISSLEKLTPDDVRTFYREHYSTANLVVGLAGGYPKNFAEKLEADFAKLPAGQADKKSFESPKLPAGTHIEIIARDTRSTAISLGFPIDVNRGSKDWPALALAASYLGQHRSSNGRLYQRLREARGLNYGDYAYVEYFPRGMFLFTPDPNLARQQQIFQIWIRPVEAENGMFALRAALYEYDKLVRDGLSQEAFETTREFLTKYASVLTQTQSARLGYALDSRYYGIPDYGSYLKTQLAKLTVAEVNAAIQRHLKFDRMRIVVVTKNADAVRDAIVKNTPSPIPYNSPKPKEIMDEDKTIEAYRINAKPKDVVVLPVAQVFE